MAFDINVILDSIFQLVHSITQLIRDLINQAVPQFSGFILLGLSILGGYYLRRRFPTIRAQFVLFVYALIIFLVLRFV